jgi:EAL domain-containing protein (putative c-di-GMP-specific phosphodiesterase class I)
MRAGLERAEFRVFVQPQFDLARGHAQGAECLLRWQHPGRGLVGPDAFIPVAEDRGLVVPLQTFLLDRVLAVVRRWRCDGVVTGALALNLTGSELGAPDFAARFRDRLTGAGLGVGDVAVEVVERVLLSERRDVIRDNLERLSDMGVAIELDDFGTGFASLSHLRDFPIDRIKIDRSFVAGIEEAPADAAIVRAMIDLAHNLGMQVIAEGVETAGQLERLRRWSCDAVQGYLVARPMPIEDLPAWLMAASGENAAAPTAAVPVPS